MFFKTLAVAAAISGAYAQRPNSTSICDYYTTGLLTNNTAENQMTLLTLVVNTAVIGNYTQPNVGITVPGILAPGMVGNVSVNLLPYFDGGLASTNNGGSSGISMNFLDSGGAEPLKKNMPANDKSSAQYLLLTHLYEYFGVLLGCSMQGGNGTAFPAYSGFGSQYDVHKFMDLSHAEVTYFITQVGMSAASFGVTEDDVNAVGTALMNTFGYKCSPAATVVPAQGSQLQSICTGDNCPEAPMAQCGLYNETIAEPSVAISSLVPGASATSTASGSSASSTPSNVSTSDAGSLATDPVLKVFGSLLAGYFLGSYL